jgi:hypothetical protein
LALFGTLGPARAKPWSLLDLAGKEHNAFPANPKTSKFTTFGLTEKNRFLAPILNFQQRNNSLAKSFLCQV